MLFLQNHNNCLFFRLKPHYFYRDTVAAARKIKIRVTGTVKIPDLEIDCCKKHHFYADQIIIDNIEYIDEKLFLQNKEMISNKVRIEVPEPFKLIQNDQLNSKQKVNIGACKTVGVSISSIFDTHLICFEITLK